MHHDLLETARAAADAAAAVHLRFALDLDAIAIREKGQSDFVSDADLESQRQILDIIRSRHPSHQILAEEEVGVEGALLRVSDADPAIPLWVVDPLDGTTNFLHSHPMHCASVGVLLHGRAVAGAVTSVATDERWWAATGQGAFLNGRPIRASRTTSTRLALVGTGFPFKALAQLPRYLDQLDRVLRGSAGIRRLGSAAMDLCYLACGRLDGFWELDLGPWDAAGGIAILEEAGAMITDLEGRPIDLAVPNGFLAANGPVLHQALGRLVRGDSPSTESGAES